MEQQIGALCWHYRYPRPDVFRDMPMRDIRLLSQSIPHEVVTDG